MHMHDSHICLVLMSHENLGGDPCNTKKISGNAYIYTRIHMHMHDSHICLVLMSHENLAGDLRNKKQYLVL